MLLLRLGIFCFLPTCLWANPTGGSVAAGSATIAGQGTGAVTINQASNVTVINWQSFSINSGESTSFLQPSATSAALNRVLGGQTSLINGTLSANGQIYLINGNGVIVGPGGVINANAFTASTRDITDADFLSGNLHFKGSSDAGVQNLGTIQALGGNVVLIGRTVDNEGTITAPRGTAGLIAGDDVLLAQKNADGSTIMVSPKSTAASATGQVGVKNGGAITAAAAELKAANGNIYALAVQNQGTIRATTISHQGGHIWLTSDSGKVSNSGKLDASATAAAGQGGSVMLKSATGAASHTGQIIVKGGDGGAGGDAEVSGAQVQFTGKVDLSAPGGKKGMLLIDPATIDIVNGGGTALTGSTIDPSAIVLALDTTNVTLTASTSITVDDLLDASGNANPGNLTLTTPVLNLNAGIKLNGTLIGSSGTVNVGAAGFIQNAIDTVNPSAIVNLSAATYALTSEIVINKSVLIHGNGAILDGQGVTRVMEIDGSSNVAMTNLTMTGGNGNSVAGAAGSSWNGDGGALLVFGVGSSSSEQITNSTFFGNSSSSGGAIFSVSISSGGNSIKLIDSTFTGNSAINGSVLYNYASFGGSATFDLTQATIAGNSGTGAIYNTVLSSGNATVLLNNSILAGNTAFSGESDYVANGAVTLSDGGYNLYGQNGNAGGFIPGSTGAATDILLGGSIATALGPLGSYGGFTQTLPLVAGSPAIDAGNPIYIGQPDQRGVTRGSPSNFTSSNSDIGAFEAQFISVQADPITVVYGETPVFTYTITNGPATASASLSGSPALISPATNVGTYGEDIGQGTLVSVPLYILDFTNGDLTINPRTVLVDPDPGQSKTYGTPDPVLTYTTTAATATTGLVNGDTLSGALGYQGEGSVTNVGTYPINLGTLASGNYTIAFGNGAPTFAIIPATLIYVADPVTVPANRAAFPVFTGNVVGFVGADTLSSATTGNVIFSTPVTPPGSPGSYPIDGSGLTANNGNYNFIQSDTNGNALTIAGATQPPPPGTTTATTVADSVSVPNTPVSQAAAQTSSSATPVPDGSLPGGSDAPLASAAPLAVNINVNSISPNEFIDGSSSGGTSSSGSADTGNLAQGSSFDPGIGGNANVVTVGETLTLGGGSAGHTPPPPVVQVALAQVLGSAALDTLTSALSLATTTDDQGGAPAPAGASTPGDADQTSTTTGGASANPNNPTSAGPVTEIAPGQTISLAGGKAGNLPPPASVQAAFDRGFSPQTRDTLAKAAGQ